MLWKMCKDILPGRYVSNHKTYEYQDRLFILELESLESRRLKKDLKMCYTIFRGVVNIEKYNLF